MPVDNIYSSRTMLEQHGLMQKYSNPLVISSDVEGVVRARAIAKHMNDTDLAIIDKRRLSPNQAEVMSIIGKVQDRHCVIVDDIVDTASTLVHAAQTLKEKGAKTVTAYCVHPVLSGDAIENITQSSIDEIVVTDTIPLTETAKKCPKIIQVTLSGLLSETISRINQKESVSQMFLD